jgi:hypothetical protein
LPIVCNSPQKRTRTLPKTHAKRKPDPALDALRRLSEAKKKPADAGLVAASPLLSWW